MCHVITLNCVWQLRYSLPPQRLSSNILGVHSWLNIDRTDKKENLWQNASRLWISLLCQLKRDFCSILQFITLLCGCYAFFFLSFDVFWKRKKGQHFCNWSFEIDVCAQYARGAPNCYYFGVRGAMSGQSIYCQSALLSDMNFMWWKEIDDGLY